MSCHVGPGIVVCTTGPSALRRRLARCPVDERITEWVVEYPDSPWYDPIWQCTACGEYADQTTGMWPRPFQGGWRAA
ncbi:MAG TPA: hypothetical protein VHH52_06880, partial [Pseudonocardiaceae bacterium]|nr:hypothetical protein [Pseudonocardiaceae bacterium]